SSRPCPETRDVAGPPPYERSQMTIENRAAQAPATVPLHAFQMVIDGEHVAAADGQEFEVVNPATARIIASAPLGGVEDVDRAVTAARRAFDEVGGWSSWSAAKR